MFGFCLTIAAAALLRIYLIVRDSIPFAYDMGRDLLWSKDISFYGVPTLIGPAASIWGVYFPPFWFYFLSIPLRLSGGHPLSAVFATAATIVATGALSYILFKRELSKFYAFTLSIIILFAGTLVNISLFAFHANILPILTLGFIYFSYKAITKNPLYFTIAVFLMGLMFSADPAPAVIFTFVAFFNFLYFKLHESKHLKKLMTANILAYLIPLSPNILFEIRNNFVQTQSLLAYFRGENPSLSGQLPLIERIGNRADIYFEFARTSFAPGNNVIVFLMFAVTCFGIYSFTKSNKNQKLAILLKINLITVVVSFVTLTVVFTPEVKIWYLYGLTIPFAFLITQGLWGLGEKKIVLLTLSVYMLINILPFAKNERIDSALSDPAQLSNQLAAIDYIYKDEKDSDFSTYVFTPSIYDHHYQYLFWWQGVRKNKGLPSEFAYLPNHPDYVRNKNIYAANPQKSNLIYLIIENSPENEFYTKNEWLKNFQDFKLIWQKDINNAIILEKRQK